MRLFRSELERTDHEINPCACAIARLPGILVVCPQAAAVLVCSVDPVGCAGLFLLLNLLWEIQERTSDLISGLVVLIRLRSSMERRPGGASTPSIVLGADADELDKPVVSSEPPDSAVAAVSSNAAA